MPEVPANLVNTEVSGDWCGYVAGVDPTTGDPSGTFAAPGPFTGVTGTWTIPVLAPGLGFTLIGAWIGIGGFKSSPDLVQCGTTSMRAGLTVDTTYNTAFLEIIEPSSSFPPRTLPVIARGGDTVRLTQSRVSYSAISHTSIWTVLFENLTAGVAHTHHFSVDYGVTEDVPSSQGCADWIVELPDVARLEPFPSDFEYLAFTNCRAAVNGGPLQIMNDFPLTSIIFYISPTAPQMQVRSGIPGPNPPGNRPYGFPSGLGAGGDSFFVCQQPSPIHGLI